MLQPRMLRYEKLKFCIASLTYFSLLLLQETFANFTQGGISAVDALPSWNVVQSSTVPVATENPQRMWDPERGSILGEDVPTLNYENVSVTNETVQVGSNTFLDCQVRNLADKKVSWIRRRDNHILTSGMLTYTNDERFSVVRTDGSDNWALLIRFVQKRDGGRYECQVSTKTGRYGYVVNLHVVVPKAVIPGPTELHIQSGSTISLSCMIKEVLTPPHFVFWYHNKKVINYDQSRGGITVQTEISANPTSKITITKAAFDDSGNYTCVATDSESASVNVFVSEGDKTAAIQRFGSDGNSLHKNSNSKFFLQIFILINLVVSISGLTKT